MDFSFTEPIKNIICEPLCNNHDTFRMDFEFCTNWLDNVRLTLCLVGASEPHA